VAQGSSNGDHLLSTFDVLILGAGAAGLLCATESATRGRRVLLLERSEKIGKKILISGGGRCNFTNVHCQPKNFLSQNPHFAKSALARYTPADFIALVEKHKIPYQEKTLGQLFCDHSAAQIVSMLESECRSAGAKIVVDARIREVRRDTSFVVCTDSAEYRTAVLVVATGGLSIPKMGATRFGYDLAKQFGLNIVPPRAALVPLLFQADDRKRYSDLAGLSTEVIATADETSFREKMLFTHRGLSGPAILQASSYWREGEPIEIDLAPECDATHPIRDAGTRTVAAAEKALHAFLPKRLAERWLQHHPPKSFTNASLEMFERELHCWKIYPAGTEGYDKAEVTLGGVDTAELSSKTMESRRVPGLFFIGEVVDVTGQLGGFNFQWAWSSAIAAARSL
jgi:predicted Rossmann fold flavoprotein